MDNRIIRTALILSNGVLVLAMLFFVLFTIFLIHWHFDPMYYSRVEVSSCFNPGYGANGFNIYPATKELPTNAIVLATLNHIMVYWLFLRGTFFVMITTMILKKVIQVLRSMQTVNTFYQGNVEHFRAIALYSFLGFIASCFNFSYLQGHVNFSFTLAFGPLLLSVAALILGEVFEEGSHLFEDKNLVI